MNNWKETTLEKVAKCVNDKICTREVNLDNYVSTENLLVDRMGLTQATTIPSISKVTGFVEDDVLFSNIRTYFKKVWQAKFKGGASNDVLVFRSIDKNKLDKNFLFYIISSDNFINFTVISAKGTKMPRGDKDAIKRFPISLPPLPEQKAIARVLGSLDDKIELLREQNETLEKTAQTIFKEWFVNLNFPDENGKAYKDNKGKMIQSELGEIPEGWRVGRLGELAILKSGYAFKSADFVERSNKKALKIKDLKGGGKVELSDVSSVGDEVVKLKRVGYFKLKSGDIVLAMSGNTTGKIGVVPEYENELYLNQRVGKFFVKNDKYKSFIYFFLMSGKYEDRILNMGYGSAQPNISPSQIEGISIVFPPNGVLDNFLEISEKVFNKVLQNNNQIQTLTKTRDVLLPKLMSGEVRVNKIKE